MIFSIRGSARLTIELVCAGALLPIVNDKIVNRQFVAISEQSGG
jgi:hypothetical protein